MQAHEAEVAAAVEAAAAGGQASRYSPEERKERIERYRSKRNLRNFQKKITVSAYIINCFSSLLFSLFILMQSANSTYVINY